MQPPDPCYYRSAGSVQILKFHDYGAKIAAWQDVYCSLQDAMRDVKRNTLNEPMGLRERQYGCVDVKLLVKPGLSLTWGMWKEAITGIAEFVTHYEFLDMDFDIVQARLVVATGILTSFS